MSRQRSFLHGRGSGLENSVRAFTFSAVFPATRIGLSLSCCEIHRLEVFPELSSLHLDIFFLLFHLSSRVYCSTVLYPTLFTTVLHQNQNESWPYSPLAKVGIWSTTQNGWYRGPIDYRMMGRERLHLEAHHASSCFALLILYCSNSLRKKRRSAPAELEVSVIDRTQERWFE